MAKKTGGKKSRTSTTKTKKMTKRSPEIERLPYPFEPDPDDFLDCEFELDDEEDQ